MMTATKNISIPNRAGLTDENLVELYRTMWEIRFFDEKVDQLFAKGLIHGTTHLAVGFEKNGLDHRHSPRTWTNNRKRNEH